MNDYLPSSRSVKETRFDLLDDIDGYRYLQRSMMSRIQT